MSESTPAESRSQPVPERSLAARILNPHDLKGRTLFLVIVLTVVLAVLILDRVAHALYWPAPGATEIILVSSERCPHSRAVKSALKARGVAYREIDARREALAAGLAGWAFQSVSVPILVVGEEIIRGNQAERIDRALDRLANAPLALRSERENVGADD